MGMNPWISIWTEPRKTISKIVDVNPNRSLWLLAWIYGFLSLLNGSQSLEVGKPVHFLLLLLSAIVLAPLWGMFIFSFWSWVVHMVGKLLKGRGSFSYIRAAFAWSCVPLTVNIALWFLGLALFGRVVLQTAQPTTGPMIIMMFILIAKVVVMIWSLVIYINALAEVQGFSIGRSIINIVLSWIAIGVAAALILMGIAFLTHSSPTIQAIINLRLGK
jgi:hypothetical protein